MPTDVPFVVTFDVVLTLREAAVVGELRAMTRLTADDDVVKLALYRMAREFDVDVHPTDFAITGGPRRRSERNGTS